MRRFLGLLGATVGGWLGWYLGAEVSIFAAFLLSILGTGVGLYIGYRFAERYS